MRRLKMPRELWAVSPEKAEMREYDEPEVKAGQVKAIPEAAAAKHGTEMASVKGYGDRGGYDKEFQVFKDPNKEKKPGDSRTGNMFVGKVTEVGPDVDNLKEGDRILSYGCFREVHVVDSGRCWKIPEDLDWRSAVCLDPADFAMGAVRDGNVRVGDAVAVFGMGAIGLMAVQIAKASGAYPVIAVEPIELRRNAATACGADIAINPLECDAGLEIKKAVGTPGVDVAIEYSGSMHAFQAALRSVAYGGTVVAGAFPPAYPAGLDLGAEAHINRPNLIFSRSCSDPNRDHPRWDEKRIFDTCLRMLAKGIISGENVIAPVVTFDELVNEYPKIATAPETNIKLGATYS
jgi:threonine dehydrogenase-like Zn-dependent dehydrogenase